MKISALIVPRVFYSQTLFHRRVYFPISRYKHRFKHRVQVSCVQGVEFAVLFHILVRHGKPYAVKAVLRVIVLAVSAFRSVNGRRGFEIQCFRFGVITLQGAFGVVLRPAAVSKARPLVLKPNRYVGYLQFTLVMKLHSRYIVPALIMPLHILPLKTQSDKAVGKFEFIKPFIRRAVEIYKFYVFVVARFSAFVILRSHIHYVIIAFRFYFLFRGVIHIDIHAVVFFEKRPFGITIFLQINYLIRSALVLRIFGYI